MKQYSTVNNRVGQISHSIPDISNLQGNRKVVPKFLQCAEKLGDRPNEGKEIWFKFGSRGSKNRGLRKRDSIT